MADESSVVTSLPDNVPAPTMKDTNGVAVTWMEKPQTVIGCPPGLEYLSDLDRILVHQHISEEEAKIRRNKEKKYQMKNSLGEQIYFLSEESNVHRRDCCGADRGFEFHEVDSTQQEIMRIVRELKCCACGCGCCAGCIDTCTFDVIVESPTGHVIGHVLERQSFFKPNLEVVDDNNQPLVRIVSRDFGCCGYCETSGVEFNLMAPDGPEEIGQIMKTTDKKTTKYGNDYEIHFRKNLETKTKGLLLGAFLLIDFMYYQSQDPNAIYYKDPAHQ